MFSVAPTPRTSFSPIPPTPMQATLSLSEGATNPRPSTCRGTTVNERPAAVTSPTNRRLVIRFFAIKCFLLDAFFLPRDGLSGRAGPEREREEHQDHQCSRGGIEPDLMPVVNRGAVRAGGGEAIHHRAGGEGPDEISGAVGDEIDEPLGGGADLRARLLVGVDLPRHEEEVVAHPVQENPRVDEPHSRARVSGAEREVAQAPGQ